MPLFVIGKLEEINLLLFRNNVILVNNNVQMIVCLSVGCDGKSFTLLLIIVTSRVQLGIVLRPLPFLPHVNDLRKHLESSLRLFADDVLLYVSSHLRRTVMAKKMATGIQSLQMQDHWCFY